MTCTSDFASVQLPLGPLMIDVAGTELTDLDCERLCHPLVGGIILFSRNYANPAQLRALTAAIHALRTPRLLIAVDHEGGRVQRFRDGFTHLPPMRLLGQMYGRDPSAALALASDVGFVLAAELRAHGVDYSFTPVLDLDYGPSRVIGDRAFHRDPEVVVALAGALGEGLREGGMGTCGKHFPGHGYVIPDSHLELPVDERPLPAMQEDIFPYRHLSLDGVMAAHVIYESFDGNTAVFSNKWNDYLRDEIKFDGVVFTDDLSMKGAGVVGDMPARVDAAYAAGCDMLLVCNAPDDVAIVLESWKPVLDPRRVDRVTRLAERMNSTTETIDLEVNCRYRQALENIAALTAKADQKSG